MNNLFSGPARTDNYQSGCQRIKCAGVTHLNFLDSQMMPEGLSDLINHIERGPCKGFIDKQDCSFKICFGLAIIHEIRQIRLMRSQQWRNRMQTNRGFLFSQYLSSSCMPGIPTHKQPENQLPVKQLKCRTQFVRKIKI